MFSRDWQNIIQYKLPNYGPYETDFAPSSWKGSLLEHSRPPLMNVQVEMLVAPYSFLNNCNEDLTGFAFVEGPVRRHLPLG